MKRFHVGDFNLRQCFFALQSLVSDKCNVYIFRDTFTKHGKICYIAKQKVIAAFTTTKVALTFATYTFPYVNIYYNRIVVNLRN